MSSLFTRLATAGLLCAAVLAPGAAVAQTDPQRAATAQTIYEQATADMDRKDYAAACRKLEEVVKLVSDALGAKMTLGECYEAQGKSASAWAQYTIVESLAAKQGQDERAQKAAKKATALRPKLATLTVEVPADVAKTPSLAITRDGVPVGEVQWGTPLPVDAGTHEVVASATGRKPWRKSVEVLGDGAKLSVTVKALISDPNVDKGWLIAPPDASRAWQKPLGIGVTALGAVGLVIGGVMGGLSMSKRDASNAKHCDAQDYCDPDGLVLRSDAMRFGNASTGAFILGGVLAGAGVVLILTVPEARRANAESTTVRVQVSRGGATIVGRF